MLGWYGSGEGCVDWEMIGTWVSIVPMEIIIVAAQKYNLCYVRGKRRLFCDFRGCLCQHSNTAFIWLKSYFSVKVCLEGEQWSGLPPSEAHLHPLAWASGCWGWNLFHPWCSALQPAKFYVLALKMECLWCIIIIIIVIIVIVIIYLHLKPQLWLAFCWALSCIQLQSLWTEWKWCGEVDKQEERSQEKFDAENVSLSRSLWCAILWPGIAWKLLILL